MYIETWHKTECDFCEAINWICDGDITDIGGVDVEAVTCWKCHKTYGIHEDVISTLDAESIKGLYAEEGKQKPE